MDQHASNLNQSAPARARLCAQPLAASVGAALLIGALSSLAAAGRATTPSCPSASGAQYESVMHPSAPLAAVTLAASKDNTLYENTNGSLSNGAGQYMFAGRTNTGRIRRAVVSFGISGSIPSGATIMSATLSLHMSRTSTGAYTVTLHRLYEDWGEAGSDADSNEGAGAVAQTGDATWLHRFYDNRLWFTQGGEFASKASASLSVAGEGPYTWASTPALVADVQSCVDSPLLCYGWLIKGDESENKTTKRFDTRESDFPDRRPVLAVGYTMDTPTPSSTPSQTPTASDTPTAGPTSTPSTTGTPTDTGTPTSTFTPSATPSPSDTATPTETSASTPTRTPSVSPTASASATGTDTPSALDTATATPTRTTTPTATGSAGGSQTPAPSATPGGEETHTPTPTRTQTPTGTWTASATPTIASPTPSATVSPSATSTPTPPPSAVPSPGLVPGVCDFILNRVPPVVITWSLSNPDQVGGWGERAIPGLPPSPFNPPRKWLTITATSLPYHPLYNGVTYKSGCP